MPVRRSSSNDSVSSNDRIQPKPVGPARAEEEVELRVMELEERIAPRLASNHNHTFLTLE